MEIQEYAERVIEYCKNEDRQVSFMTEDVADAMSLAQIAMRRKIANLVRQQGQPELAAEIDALGFAEMPAWTSPEEDGFITYRLTVRVAAGGRITQEEMRVIGKEALPDEDLLDLAVKAWAAAHPGLQGGPVKLVTIEVVSDDDEDAGQGG